MPAEISVSRDGLEPAGLDTQATGWSARTRLWVRWPVAHWELIVGGLGVVAAAVAFWVTLHAHFLQYPGWLAVQKADFILGPIFVGLYWHHRRPDNRLGLMLIALGLVFIPYMLESIRSPYAFTIGTMDESWYIPVTLAIVLAFPNGRLDGRAERLILVGSLLGITLLYVVWLLVSPAQLIPRGSLAACRALCPRDPFAIWSTPSWYSQSVDYLRVSAIVVNLATVGLLVWKFVTGTPPRRRALAVGAPIAVCYLLAQSIYQAVQLVATHFGRIIHQVYGPWQWVIAGGRALVWYGFLFALIGAELYAGRVLRRLDRDSLERPTFRELEGLLRGPLGDPGLRLGFWRAESREWIDADGVRLAAPGAGQDVTEVDRDGRAVIAIVHDEQLSEDPELLQAAGAIALLSLENAELEDAWKQALREVADSRARLASAGERERQKLERDLHDGAQQRLVGIQVRLRLLHEDQEKRHLDERLTEIRVEAEEAVEELRTLAHGIYPPLLRARGLADALRSVAMRAPVPIEVTDNGIGRCSPAVEAALYFCSLEAVQNALKHAGGGAHVTVVVGRDRGEVYFTVADDGVGIASSGASDGTGLVNMRDRISAVGGALEVVFSPGVGTTIRGIAPSDGPSPRDDGRAASAATLPPRRR